MIEIYPHVEPAAESPEKDGRFFELASTRLGMEILPVSSGRAAAVSGLRALGLGRMDEILVPPYLGQCVLSALLYTSFPAMTASSRTRAILVYHQFGFPQDIDAISKVAEARGWVIVNDCANSVFSMWGNDYVARWGDMTVLSLWKIYGCGLGGGLLVRDEEKRTRARAALDADRALHEVEAERVRAALLEARQDRDSASAVLTVAGVYGKLPLLGACPPGAVAAMPSSAEEIDADIGHRQTLWARVRKAFSERVPQCDAEAVVPFAVPVVGEERDLRTVADRVRAELGFDCPILRFDFGMNMLEPDYRKALVIGCHSGWTEEAVDGICRIASGVLA